MSSRYCQYLNSKTIPVYTVHVRYGCTCIVYLYEYKYCTVQVLMDRPAIVFNGRLHSDRWTTAAATRRHDAYVQYISLKSFRHSPPLAAFLLSCPFLLCEHCKCTQTPSGTRPSRREERHTRARTGTTTETRFISYQGTNKTAI